MIREKGINNFKDLVNLAKRIEDAIDSAALHNPNTIDTSFYNNVFKAKLASQNVNSLAKLPV